jgi:transposase
VTCPAGQTTDRTTENTDGATTYHFDGRCTGCPLRAKCTTSTSGRSLSVHPQERLRQEAREYQSTPEGRANLRTRVIVENSLARLAHLGIGKARYNGHNKTRFQLGIACALANLRRSWNWALEQASNSSLDQGSLGVTGQKMQPNVA